jgi:hypothetical protein
MLFHFGMPNREQGLECSLHSAAEVPVVYGLNLFLLPAFAKQGD